MIVVLHESETARGGVSVLRDPERRRIVVAPRGHFTIECARPAIECVVGAAREAPIELVGDCRLLSGYDTEVRVAWQHALASVRDRLIAARFVGVRAPIIRLGIETIGLLIGMEMQIVEQLEGID